LYFQQYFLHRWFLYHQIAKVSFHGLAPIFQNDFVNLWKCHRCWKLCFLDYIFHRNPSRNEEFIVHHYYIKYYIYHLAFLDVHYYSFINIQFLKGYGVVNFILILCNDNAHT
jgi:hypothetical protein